MTVNQTLLSAAVAATVEAGKATAKSASAGAKIAAALSALYADVAGDKVEFARVFGNGRPPKAKDFVAGEYAELVNASIARCPKEARDTIKATLKTRLSEVRKLHKAGGMPAKDETIQQALKRYAPAAAAGDAKPKTDGKASDTKVVIADDASMDDIADAFSVWVAKHGNAAVGLAAKLADFLPVTVKRTRKSA